MSNFSETATAENFVATTDSRETSEEVLSAIAFHATSLEEAEQIWVAGSPDWCTTKADAAAFAIALVETATDNHDVDPSTLFWGDVTLDEYLDEATA